jgi:exodeoxyribonuclease VII small subunit
LSERIERARAGLGRGTKRVLERDRQRLVHTRERLRRAPGLAIERKRATLEQAAGRLRALSPRATLGRGYAIVRTDNEIVASTADVSRGDSISVEVADGAFGALEQIVERLERGEAELNQAIALWERGEELYRLCRGRLDAAQGKIEQLAQRAEASRPLDTTPRSTS